MKNLALSILFAMVFCTDVFASTEVWLDECQAYKKGGLRQRKISKAEDESCEIVNSDSYNPKTKKNYVQSNLSSSTQESNSTNINLSLKSYDNVEIITAQVQNINYPTENSTPELARYLRSPKSHLRRAENNDKKREQKEDLEVYRGYRYCN